MEKFDLDMSLLARLGGHSAPRTHRGKERFPGGAQMTALLICIYRAIYIKW